MLMTFGVVFTLGASSPQQCPDKAARMRELALEQLDQSFKEHVDLLFDIWMKDIHEQPVRAAKGMEQVAKAYLHSRQAFEKWQPPCR